MQPHVGGVKGTVLFRAYCPVCKRGVAGGNRERDRSKIELRHHKVAGTHPGRPWCSGSGAVVPPDYGLMDAWSARLRRLAERRSTRRFA